MFNVIICEDEESAFRVVENYLTRYTRENGEEFRVVHYKDVLSLLDEYKPNYDIVFMDIELPHMNGLEGSHKLRELDQAVTIIFITNMAQFAVKGYEVDAFDFVVKPVTYAEFSLKLKRALERIKLQHGQSIGFTTKDGVQKLSVTQITYIESYRHQITIHTIENSFEIYGTLKAIEDSLPEEQFVRCNSGYLVNLRHVDKIKNNSVFVHGEELPLSRAKKKEFMDALNHYLIRKF